MLSRFLITSTLLLCVFAHHIPSNISTSSAPDGSVVPVVTDSITTTSTITQTSTSTPTPTPTDSDSVVAIPAASGSPAPVDISQNLTNVQNAFTSVGLGIMPFAPQALVSVVYPDD